MPAPTATFAITSALHPDCEGCRRAAQSAAIMARAMGSRGATHQDERRDADGAIVITHGATVARSFGTGGAVSDRRGWDVFDPETGATLVTVRWRWMARWLTRRGRHGAWRLDYAPAGTGWPQVNA